MRISFVLILVLALATSAQAALSLSISFPTPPWSFDVTVSVSSDNTDGWTWAFVLSEDTYNWTDPVAAKYQPDRLHAVTIYVAAGDKASNTPDAGYAAVTWLGVDGITVPPVAGKQFDIKIRGVQAGTIYVDLQDGAGVSQIGGALEIVIPEPMTITLLALGGLLLRRRGKI